MPISHYSVSRERGETAGHLQGVFLGHPWIHVIISLGFPKVSDYIYKNELELSASSLSPEYPACFVISSSPRVFLPDCFPVSFCHHHGTPDLLLCSVLHLTCPYNCKLLERLHSSLYFLQWVVSQSWVFSSCFFL